MLFLEDNYFVENEYQAEEFNKTQKIKILFSDNINEINETEDKYLLNLEKNFGNIFQNLKTFFNNSYISYNKETNKEDKNNNFIYTEKQIKIPKEDIDANSINNEKEKTQKEYLKRTKIIIKNNLIYSFRPLFKLKPQKKRSTNYFSNKEIYVVDIFKIIQYSKM